MSLARREPFGARWSLAVRLTLAMLLVAAVAMAGLFYELDRANRAEIERLQTTALANSALDLAQTIDALVHGEQRRVANLALSRAAQEFVAASAERRAPLFTPTLADFVNFLDSNRPFYRAVLLLDPAGEVLLATDGSYVGLRFPESAFFQAARAGQVYMSDPGISPLDRQPVIWVSAPVYMPDDSGRATPDAVLTVALSPEELWQVVEQVRIGEGGYAMLLDSYGIRLAHGGDRNYIFRGLAPLPDAAWAELRAQGRFADLPRLETSGGAALLRYVRDFTPASVLVAAPGPGVGRVYYSAAKLSGRDWTVVAMLSEREVLAPALGATLRGAIVTILVVVLLGLTVGVAAQRLLRPVPRLAAAATRIADGDLGAVVTVEGSSEVRLLARNFETMRHNLAHARDELAAWAATLERRVAQRSQELAALSAVVALSGRGRSSAVLLRTALDQLLPVMDAQMGVIWLAEPDGALALAASVDLDPALAARLARVAPGAGPLAQVQSQVAALTLADLAGQPGLAPPFVAADAALAFVAVPLVVGRRSLGVLGGYRRGGPFSPEAVALAGAIGQQIALALENIALIGQVEIQARNVATLTERERIAGEIHDGIAQNLGYLYLQLDQLADAVETSPVAILQGRLAGLQGVLETTTADVRRFISRLQEHPPAPAPLAGRLLEEAERLAEQLGLTVAIEVGPGADIAVPVDMGAELSRIVGEALRNAARHGHAAHARVELERAQGQIHLRVRDDGKGFDPTAPPDAGREHFGLSVMRARAARIGGALRVESRPGAGTCVEVAWTI